jgi:hypothetical protein
LASTGIHEVPFVIQNQFALILGCFMAGILGWTLVLRQPAKSRAWKIADLVWVGLGGFGAMAALIAGVYRADTSRINRQIDLSYSTIREFDRDAARFRLRYCQPEFHVGLNAEAARAAEGLCGKVEFLSASTARNRDLPLFVEVTKMATPLQNLRLFAPARDVTNDGMTEEKMIELANAFDPIVLSFEATDETTRAASATLHASRETNEVAADFQVLANTYGNLIDEVETLKSEWDFLRSHAQFLSLQIVALCMVAFAAPFRLGKSLADLRK